MTKIYQIIILSIIISTSTPLFCHLKDDEDAQFYKKELLRNISQKNLANVLNIIYNINEFLILKNTPDEEQAFCDWLFDTNLINETLNMKNFELSCFILLMGGKNLNDFFEKNRILWPQIFLNETEFKQLKEEVKESIDAKAWSLLPRLAELPKIVNQLNEKIRTILSELKLYGAQTLIGQRHKLALSRDNLSAPLLKEITNFYANDIMPESLFDEYLTKLKKSKNPGEYFTVLDTLLELLTYSHKDINVFMREKLDLDRDPYISGIRDELLKLLGKENDSAIQEFLMIISHVGNLLDQLARRYVQNRDNKLTIQCIDRYVNFLLISILDQAVVQRNFLFVYLLLHQLISLMTRNDLYELVHKSFHTVIQNIFDHMQSLNKALFVSERVKYTLLSMLKRKFAVSFIIYHISRGIQLNSYEGIETALLALEEEQEFNEVDLRDCIARAFSQVVPLGQKKKLYDEFWAFVVKQYKIIEETLDQYKTFNQILEAVSAHNLNEVERILNSQAFLWPLRETDSNGDSILIKAVRGDNDQLIDMLIKKSAQTYSHLIKLPGLNMINYQGNFGHSALIEATKKAHLPAVRALLESNADIALKDVYGHDALYYATHPVTLHENNADIKHLLSKAVEKSNGHVKEFSLDERIRILKMLNAGLYSLAYKNS